MDVLQAESRNAPGSIEADAFAEPAQGSAPGEDTSARTAGVPDWDAPDEEGAAEGDSPPDSLLDQPIPREQQPGILRVRLSELGRASRMPAAS